MATAVVHTVFASLSRSFKLSSPVEIRGALVQDRITCVAGDIKKKVKMIPVTIELFDAHQKVTHTVQVNIVNHPRWFPMILNYASFMAEDAYEPTSRPRTVVSDYLVTLSNGEEMAFREVSVTNPQSFVGTASAGGNTIGKVLDLLRNPYQKLGVEKVAVRHEFIPEMRSAMIKRAWALDPEVPLGKKVRIRLLLEHWRSKESTLDIEVPLPPEVRSGEEVTISVAGASSADRLLPPYNTLEEMIRVLRKEYRPTDVVAKVHLTKLSFLFRGRTLERLPGSIIAQLVPGLAEQATVATTPVETTADVGKVVVGSADITVKVK
jgi:hypothetical protein